MPWLRWLFEVLSLWRPWFDLSRGHERLSVEEVAMGQFSIRVLRISPVIIIPSMFHTHLLVHVALTRRYNSRSLETIQKVILFLK